ncbi:allergin-1 isoform 2-T2 [Discoglossus pictus]
MFQAILLFSLLCKSDGANGPQVNTNLSKPKLISESSTTMIGQNKTIRCLSKNGSLPITFSLFLNKSTQGVSTVSHEREATFYVLIQNIGPYKCKANNSNNSVRYSQEFNFSLLEPLINTSIRSDTSLTTRGHNETLQCLSKSGSLPITYVLLRNSSVLETITVTERRLAEFHISIVNTHSLGPFRCRANNSVTNSSLSEELSFIMQGENASWRLILCILLPLFLVLIILAFVFTRICKHKKGPTGLLPIDRVYSDGSTEETAMEKHQEVKYSTIVFSENRERTIISEDSVQYAEILKRDCNGGNTIVQH